MPPNRYKGRAFVCVCDVKRWCSTRDCFDLSRCESCLRGINGSLRAVSQTKRERVLMRTLYKRVCVCSSRVALAVYGVTGAVGWCERSWYYSFFSFM